jgi:RHS repeat-associated protein
LIGYKYDPFGRRIEKNVAGAITRYIYDGGRLLEEQDSNGGAVARYTQSPAVDEPLIMDRSGQSYFYLRDGVGSVVALADATAALVQTYNYDSFGRSTAAAGAAPAVTNPFQFGAREFDAESGLDFNRTRYYDPATGRFLQRDPLSYGSRRPRRCARRNC